MFRWSVYQIYNVRWLGNTHPHKDDFAQHVPLWNQAAGQNGTLADKLCVLENMLCGYPAIWVRIKANMTNWNGGLLSISFEI